VISVHSERDADRARRAAMALADAQGMGRIKKMELATAVSELAHNLVWHTDEGGTVTLRTVQRGEQRGLEVICQDRGPGIADVELAMQDGYSAGGGLGGGLPGARRLMDEFWIESEIGKGTTIVARKWA